MRVQVTVKGDLNKHMADEYRNAERAVTRGVRTATNDAKLQLRQQIVRAGLGRRLSRTVRSQVFPRSGDSAGAAGLIWTKAPHILGNLARGGVIRSSRGFFLAIPSPAAPKRGVGRKRLTPSNFPEHRFGPLRFVYRRNGASLLVVDGLRASFSRKTGQMTGFRRASARAQRTGKGLTTVVMFFLVPQVHIRRRLDIERVRIAALRRLPGLIIRSWPEPRSGAPTVAR